MQPDQPTPSNPSDWQPNDPTTAPLYPLPTQPAYTPYVSPNTVPLPPTNQVTQPFMPPGAAVPVTPQLAYQTQPTPLVTSSLEQQYPAPGASTYSTIQQPQPFAPAIPTEQTPYSPAPQTSHKSRWRPLVAVGLAICIVLAGGAFALRQFTSPLSPDKTFQAAIINAFSTSSVTQSISSGTDSAIVQFDVKNVKDARLSATATVNQGSSSVTLTGYGSVKNSYAKLENFKGDSELPAASLDKWIQIRQNGVLPSDANTSETLSNFYDPNTALIGEYVYGNFSSTDRQTLLGVVNSNHVFTYDPKKVTTSKIGNDSVFVYKVSVNSDGVTKVSQKAAEIYGTDKADADFAGLQATNTATMYISKKSRQLVKVTSDTATVTYSKFNATILPSEPKATISYADFIAQQATVPSSSGNSAADVTRKADIDTLDAYIESYYADSGNYPTIRELNDTNWLATNMPDVTSDITKDPNGTLTTFADTPTKNQFAYEYGTDSSLSKCDSDVTTCAYFQVSATLSNGKIYSKSSQ